MDITVSGAGKSSVNGTYTENGTFGGYPIYFLSGITAYEHCIQFDGGGWTIYDGYTEWVYYTLESPSTPDQVSSWTVGYGSFSPAPTVTAGGGTPTISITGSFSDFGTVDVGQFSAEQNISVSGSNLSANITVAPPDSNFQVSLSSGSGFGSSVSVTQSGGSAGPTTVYCRFSPQSSGAKSGNVTASSTGASTQNAAVSGTGKVPPRVRTHSQNFQPFFAQ